MSYSGGFGGCGLGIMPLPPLFLIAAVLAVLQAETATLAATAAALAEVVAALRVLL